MASPDASSAPSPNPFLSYGSPSGTSSPDIDTSIPSLSSVSFMRSFKSCPASPTLIGISEEVEVRRFVKVTPTMKVMGKGNGLEVTSLTPCEAGPELVDTSTPAKEFEIDTTQIDKKLEMMVTRSASQGPFSTRSKRSKVKAYKPRRSPGHKEGRKLKQLIENENDDSSEDASVEPQSYGEAYTEFSTAQSSPVRCLSVAGILDMDGLYDNKPQFSPGTAIQDFAALPDHLRGPCFEVSPRTSILDGPTALSNLDKLWCMNKKDSCVESSLMRPLEAVQEGSPETLPNVAENRMEQSDGPAPVPAIKPNVGGDSPVPELPVDPLEKEKKGSKRTHRAINKFRVGVRKGRYRCLRTPVLVVLVGKEMSKPTKMAIENIASGLPSGLGDVKPLPE
ncbi:hypothetical protein NHQ30_010656 [Ciborinia camelliae]|nr:hypothetical protein NHQ30_010656 [Ciborinia camelliae]